jgi:FAD-dependent oxidoreductase family protein
MSQSTIEFKKEIPIKINCDILIIGGSQSGVAAAVCAKRANPDANIHLVEQYGYLGGQSVGVMVCHFEFREYTNNKGEVVAKGIGKEIITRIVKKGHSDPLYQEWLDGIGPPFTKQKDPRAHGDIPLDVEDIKLVLHEMCTEEKINVHLNTKLIDVQTSKENTEFIAPDMAIVSNSYELYAIRAKIIVDCSANNDIAWKIDQNAVSIPEIQVMPMQTYAWFGGVDPLKFVNDVWEHKNWWGMSYPNNKEQMRRGKFY